MSVDMFVLILVIFFTIKNFQELKITKKHTSYPKLGFWGGVVTPMALTKKNLQVYLTWKKKKKKKFKKNFFWGGGWIPPPQDLKKKKKKI